MVTVATETATTQYLADISKSPLMGDDGLTLYGNVLLYLS